MARANSDHSTGAHVGDREERASRIHDRVAEACRFVGAGHDVGGVHIVTGRRPTFGQMCEFQMCASVNKVRLSVDRTGMISVWPMAREDK